MIPATLWAQQGTRLAVPKTLAESQCPHLVKDSIPGSRITTVLVPAGPQHLEQVLSMPQKCAASRSKARRPRQSGFCGSCVGTPVPGSEHPPETWEVSPGLILRRCELDEEGIAFWEPPTYIRCVSIDYRNIQMMVRVAPPHATSTPWT